MRILLTLALKDLRLLWRDRFGLFWILAFPLIFALFFGAIFSGDRGTAPPMKVALVDEDGGAEARAFLKRLDENRSVESERMDLAAARDAVRRGRRAAYVRVEKGFGDAAGYFSGEAPPVEIGIDPARSAESGYLEGIVLQAAWAGVQERFSDRDATKENLRQAKKRLDGAPALTGAQRERLRKFLDDLEGVLGSLDPAEIGGAPRMEAARVRKVDVTRSGLRPRSSWEITFPSAILWAVLGCAAGFAIGIVVERTQGTFLRLRVAPLSRAQVLAGKGLACFIACLTVSVLFLAIGRLVFGVRIAAPGLLGLAILATAVCFVGIMMFLSVLGKTEQAVGGAGWAILTVMAMLGGGMVPLFIMPPWLQTASHASPVKWGIVALEGAIWRGFTPAEMILPCAILVATGLGFFALGARVFARAET